MKRILIFILVFMLCIPLNVKAYEPTGHKGILDVAFENGGKLLARMKPSDYQIAVSYTHLTLPTNYSV